MNTYRIEYELPPLRAIYISEVRAESIDEAKGRFLAIQSRRGIRIRRTTLIHGGNATIDTPERDLK